MSNFTDFFSSASGGGTPINGVTAIYSTNTIFTDDDGKQYLKGGNIIETGLENYPNVESRNFNILGTVADGNSFNLSTADFTTNGAFTVSDDGLNMYAIDANSTYGLQYKMTTPFDLSTASYFQRKGLVDGTPNSMHINAEGTKMIVNLDAYNAVRSYNLSTPFDLDTISQTGNANISNTSGWGVCWAENGNSFFIALGTTIAKYACLTPYNVQNAALVSSGATGNPSNIGSISISPDGTTMIVPNQGSDQVRSYSFGTPFDPTTLSLNAVFTIGSTDNNPRAIFVDSSGDKMISINQTTRVAYGYDLTAPYIGITNPLSSYDYLRIL